MLDYPNLIRLEQEIKDLLDYRLVEYQCKEVNVEAYYAMGGAITCRIELFASVPEILDRIAKYEAELKEGFYYEAEQILIHQLELITIKNAS